MQNNDGMTALILAIRNNHCSLAKFLITKGANINMQDKNGIRALIYAVKNLNVLKTDYYNEIEKIQKENMQDASNLIKSIKKTYQDYVDIVMLHNANIKDNDR